MPVFSDGIRVLLKYNTDGIPSVSDLDAFSKLFIISGDTDIAAECTSGGGVQLVDLDETTILPIELIDSLTDLPSGDVAFRVRLDLLTSASVGDGYCWLYVSGSESTTEDPTNVWDSDTIGAWPLEDDPTGSSGDIIDSTGNNDLTSNGSMSSAVAGQVGNSLDFDGSNDYLSGSLATNSVASNNAFTIEMLFKFGGGSGLYDIFISGSNSVLCYTDQRDGFSKRMAFAVRAGFGGPTSDYYVALDNNWHYAAFRYHGSAIGIVFDGTVVTDDGISFTLPTTTDSFQLGYYGSYSPWDGQLDETVYSQIYRSDEWLAYRAIDLLANSDTFTLGTWESVGGGGVTIPALDQGMLTGGLSTLCGGLA